MAGPVTYGEAAALPFPDALMRWQELEQRDRTAGCDGEDVSPLTVDEHLELLALAQVIVSRFQQDQQVVRAMTAGASWEQVSAALGHAERRHRPVHPARVDDPQSRPMLSSG